MSSTILDNFPILGLNIPFVSGSQVQAEHGLWLKLPSREVFKEVRDVIQTLCRFHTGGRDVLDLVCGGVTLSAGVACPCHLSLNWNLSIPSPPPSPPHLRCTFTAPPPHLATYPPSSPARHCPHLSLLVARLVLGWSRLAARNFPVPTSMERTYKAGSPNAAFAMTRRHNFGFDPRQFPISPHFPTCVPFPAVPLRRPLSKFSLDGSQ